MVFMDIRKPYSGIDGWLTSSQNDGFMDGQCTIFNTGAYHTLFPNTLHRLLPDTDYSPILMSYTISVYLSRRGYQEPSGSTSYSIMILNPNRHAPRYTPPSPYDHRICNERRPSAFWYLPHERYLCARSGKSSTSCSHMG